MNWASLGAGDKRTDDSPEYTIFVGDLAGDVTDYILQETFKAVYQSVKGAKVVIDRVTGRSKGYGFVKFGDEREQQRAMTEMNGVLCSTRPMRIGPAANKKPMNAPTQNGKKINCFPTSTLYCPNGFNSVCYVSSICLYNLTGCLCLCRHSNSPFCSSEVLLWSFRFDRCCSYKNEDSGISFQYFTRLGKI